jgi:integrase
MESKAIDRFLKYGAPSKSTEMTYRSHLKEYFKVLKVKDPDKYFDNGRDYKTDVKDFALAIRDRPPNTQKSKLSCIRKFLSEFDIEFPNKFWNRIKMENHLKGNRTIVEEKIPNNSQLKQILQFGGIKERALFLLNATSGTRIDEVLSLTFNDIDMENRMIRIREEVTKSRYKRITFFTEEAKEALEAWLELRPKYLRNSYAKSKFVRESFEKHGYKFNITKNRTWKVSKDGKPITTEQLIEKENRIFPFGYHTALNIWRRLLAEAGSPFNEKDENPKLKFPRYKFHIHTLKKFWFRCLENTGANRNHIDSIGAHESELNGIYAKFAPETLKETYDQYSNSLSIFSDMDKFDKMYKPKIAEQDTAISSLTRKNKEYEDLIQQLKIQNERIESVSNHQFDRIRMLEYRIEDMSYQRTLDQDQNATEEMKEKEYLKKFPTAKERLREWDRLYDLMKTDKSMTAEEKTRYWFLNNRIYWRLKNKDGAKKHWTDELIT